MNEKKSANRDLAARMRAAGVPVTPETWTAAKAGTLAALNLAAPVTAAPAVVAALPALDREARQVLHALDGRSAVDSFRVGDTVPGMVDLWGTRVASVLTVTARTRSTVTVEERFAVALQSMTPGEFATPANFQQADWLSQFSRVTGVNRYRVSLDAAGREVIRTNRGTILRAKNQE